MPKRKEDFYAMTVKLKLVLPTVPLDLPIAQALIALTSIGIPMILVRDIEVEEVQAAVADKVEEATVEAVAVEIVVDVVALDEDAVRVWV